MRDWRRWIPEPEGEPFALCLEPTALPGLWDLDRRPDVVSHWTRILRANARYVIRILEVEGSPDQRRAADKVVGILEGLYDDLDRGEATREVRTVHEITLIREHLFRAHGLHDPYVGIKAREASRILPRALERAEAAWAGTSDPSRMVADLWAGNLFDLGSRSTQEAFRRGELDTDAASERLHPRAIEALDALPAAGRAQLVGDPIPLGEAAAGRVLVFADNAGPDFLLGIVPAALAWARRWEVWVVTNSYPASSDITIDEARALFALFPPVGEASRAGRLRWIGSGTGSPGIDFRFVSPDLNRAAHGASWMVIDGQGRGVETNWNTRYVCPALTVAVVKDALVAREIGLEPGSPLLRWVEGGG